MNTPKLLYAALFSSCLALTTACSSSSSSTQEAQSAESVAMATITGEVTFKEKMLLSQGSTLKVALVDVSKQGIKADLIARKMIRIKPNQKPPYEFELEYDKNKLVENHEYSVHARLELSGKLRATSPERHDPFTSEGPLSIVIQAVGLNPGNQTIKSENAPSNLEQGSEQGLEQATEPEQAPAE